MSERFDPSVYRAARALLGIGQAEAAQHADVSQSTIAHLERETDGRRVKWEYEQKVRSMYEERHIVFRIESGSVFVGFRPG
jgi:DNA-binding XRE family transcriptional regulator